LYSLIAHIHKPTAYSKLDQNLEKLRFSLKSSKLIDSIKYSVQHHIDKVTIFKFLGPCSNINHENSLYSLIAHNFNPTAYSKLNQYLEKLRFSLKSSKLVN